MNPSYKYDKYEFEVGTNKALRNIFHSSGYKGLLSLPCSILDPGNILETGCEGESIASK
jgi:hypothetical protein